MNKHFIAATLNEEYECIFNMYKNVYIMYVMSKEDPRFNKFSSNNYDTISISVCILVCKATHVSQPITNHPWTIYVCQNQTYDVIAYCTITKTLYGKGIQ